MLRARGFRPPTTCIVWYRYCMSAAAVLLIEEEAAAAIEWGWAERGSCKVKVAGWEVVQFMQRSRKSRLDFHARVSILPV